MKKQNPDFWLIISILSVPLLIYFYFYRWRTQAIYGDDLVIFKDITSSRSISGILQTYIASGKYRPVHALSAGFIFDFFYKDVTSYFFFNVIIQTINTYLLALVLNLYFKSPLKSLLFSLGFGLTRFCLFNITQLYNGGALEGLAMSFFLLTLFFILKALFAEEGKSKISNSLLYALFFANLCVYTHERYIVLFAFITFVAFFYPKANWWGWKQRFFFAGLCLLSIALNVFIKKAIYHMPFFVGTGGTHISFSFKQASRFFIEGIFSIFQFNEGPDYLIGTSYHTLSPLNTFILIVFGLVTVSIFSVYLYQSIKNYTQKSKEEKRTIFSFFATGTLFVLCLIPAVVTIRLEQRWLQASFSIFIVFLAIALSAPFLKRKKIAMPLFTFLIAGLLYLNHQYIAGGIDAVYYKSAERISRQFNDFNVVKKNSETLYVWHKKNDDNTNNEINWSVGSGYLYDFYQGKNKNIVFIDSLFISQKGYQPNIGADSSLNSHISKFDKNTFQVVGIINGALVDVGNNNFGNAE